MKLRNLLRMPRFFSSVFTRLTLISLVTWFLIVVAIIAAFLISRHDREGPFYRNADRYIQYIVADIGSPPAKKRAEKLAMESGVYVSYQGENERWTTNSSFSDIGKIRFRSLHGSDKLAFGRGEGHRFLRWKTEAGIFFFEFSDADEEKQRRQSHLFLFLFLTLALLCCYLAIKRVLRPLKWVSTGVQQVTEGNLGYRVPVRGNDEFTDMAKSFNEMTEQISSLMATKENLLRDVSHELRSPLTRMRVALELLEKTEERQEIEADIIEMEAMINMILETARRHHDTDQTNRVQHDLGDVVQSVAVKYNSSSPGVIFTPSKSPLYVYIDERSIQTVISNCIENAIKYSNKDSEPIRVDLVKDRKRAKILIRDDGCGIDESQLPFIFEPFYRIDPSRSRTSGGYGLGLSICKKIIDAHGGTIDAKSTKDMGTTITIHLDLCGL